MASNKPSLSDIIRGVHTAVDAAEVAQDAADSLASPTNLRRRAEEHARKAERARTRVGRAWHYWRADRLNGRAANIERGG